MAYNPSFVDIEYAARTAILEAALKVASIFDYTRFKDDIDKASKVITYLKAIQNDDSLTFDEKTQIYQCIISTAGIFDFPVAPQLGSASVPDIILGGSGNTVIINQGSSLTQGSNTDIDVTTETVDTFATNLYQSVLWLYKVTSPSGAIRSGTISATWTGSLVEWAEASTLDLNGDTSGLTFDVTNNGTVIALRATVTSNNWQVYFTRIPNYIN